MKVVRGLFVVNMIALVCFVVLTVLFLFYEQYDLGVMLAVVSALSGLNNYRMWTRLKSEKRQ